MAIKLFVFLLLITSVAFLTFTTIFTNKTTTTKNLNDPIITFQDSTMYNLDEKEVTHIIQSKTALHYKNKDELFDATIILKSQNKNKENLTDNITSKYILKQGDNLTFKDDVIFNRNNEFILNTPFLTYNIEEQIGENNHKFQVKDLDNILTGKKLYFDGKNGIIMANQTKFKIKMESK